MTKQNSLPPRTYDEHGYRLRGGCVCYKDNKEDHILLISSLSSPMSWKLPGGGVDPGENAKEAAVREVLEEAGVIGELDRCIGKFKDEERKTVTFMYSMIVTQLVASLEGRKRRWFSLSDAVKELSRQPHQLSYIKKKVYTDEEYCKLMLDSEVRHY